MMMMVVVVDGDDDGDVVGADGRGVVVAHAPALGQEPAGGTCRGGLPGLPARVAALSSREEALARRPTLVARQTSAGTVGASPDTAPSWTAARTTLWGGTAAPFGSSQAFAALGSSDGASDDGGGGIGEEWRCWQAEVAGVGSAAQRPAFVRG